jgi:hypothetical protein
VQQQTIQAPKAVGAPYTVATPTTAAEYRVLRQRREEISEQITSASSRRNRTADQLSKTDPTARAGLQQRLAVLDERIVQLERELEGIGAAVRSVPAALAVASQGPGPADIAARISSDIVPIIAILSVFVLGPMSIALSRFIWRRAGGGVKAPPIDQASQARLDQLQQSVDTIAIEVERISEGQRFVTKLLSEGKTPALKASSDR